MALSTVTVFFLVPGIVALLALALFFGSHYIVNLAGWGEIILFLFGVAMLLVEIFLIPGFGVVGIAGTSAAQCRDEVGACGGVVHAGGTGRAGARGRGAPQRHG